MNVEERLMDALFSDDAWAQRPWTDPIGRITAAYRRRRRRRVVAGAGISAVVAGLVAFGVNQVHIGTSAKVEPAGGGTGRDAATTRPDHSSTDPTASGTALAAQRQAEAASRRAGAAAADCPQHAGQVTADMADAAYRAVVRYARTREPGFDARSLKQDRVVVASADAGRGTEVTASCGSGVAARTLVVYTTRTDLAFSASLSEGVYFVSRLGSELQVWRQAH